VGDLRCFGHVGRYFSDIELRSEFFAGPDVCFHLDEINNAFEPTFATDGKLDGDGVGPQDVRSIWKPRLQSRRRYDPSCLTNAMRGLCTCWPDANRLGLRLDSADGTEHGARAVEHTQTAFDFDVKSTWPGVSIILTRWSRQKQVVAALGS